MTARTPAALIVTARFLFALVAIAAGLAVAGSASAAPNIVTVAGTSEGFGGNGGPATEARLNNPRDVGFMPDGSYLIADPDNNRIRRVRTDGVILVAAGGSLGLSGDGGQATSAQFNKPHDAVAFQGGYLVADWNNHRVRQVDANGVVQTVAGTSAGLSGDGGPATAAQLNLPRDIAPTADGGYLIADEGNHRIRRVAPNGTITTVAGSGSSMTGGAFTGDGGPAVDAQLNGPRAVAVMSDGGYLIADSGNHRIRRVSPSGTITTVAGSGSSTTGAFTGDGGTATSARLNFPRGVSVDPTGGFLIADTNNNRIRRVSSGGTISTVAGSAGGPALEGDGGPATSARLAKPRAAVPAPGGGFMVVDTDNHRVRFVDAPPSLATMSPSTALAGAAELQIELSGSRFTAASVVLWNGSPRDTVFVSSSLVRVTIAALDLQAAGDVEVRATSGSVANGTSAPLTFRVDPAAPVNIELPKITGTPFLGEALKCSTGTWGRSPTSFARAWFRKGNSSELATGESYTVVLADVGRTLSCEVTATNALGSTVATSVGVSPSGPAAPPASSPPILIVNGPTGPVRVRLLLARRARPGSLLPILLKANKKGPVLRVALQERRRGKWASVRVIVLSGRRAAATIRLDRRRVHVYRLAYRQKGILLRTSAVRVQGLRAS